MISKGASRYQQILDNLTTTRGALNTEALMTQLRSLGLIGLGAGAGARGLQGLWNVGRRNLAQPSPGFRGPLTITVPEKEEEKIASGVGDWVGEWADNTAGATADTVKQFFGGGLASGVKGHPFTIPASLGVTGGGLYGGWKLMDWLLDKRRKSDLTAEVDKAKQDYETALLSQYKTAGSLNDELDQLFDACEKRGGPVADILGGLTGAALAGMGGIGLLSGLATYNITDKRSKTKLLARARQQQLQRLRAKRPAVIYAQPTPMPRGGNLDTTPPEDELEGEPLDKVAVGMPSLGGGGLPKGGGGLLGGSGGLLGGGGGAGPLGGGGAGLGMKPKPLSTPMKPQMPTPPIAPGRDPRVGRSNLSAGFGTGTRPPSVSPQPAAPPQSASPQSSPAPPAPPAPPAGPAPSATPTPAAPSIPRVPQGYWDQNQMLFTAANNAGVDPASMYPGPNGAMAAPTLATLLSQGRLEKAKQIAAELRGEKPGQPAASPQQPVGPAPPPPPQAPPTPSSLPTLPVQPAGPVPPPTPPPPPPSTPTATPAPSAFKPRHPPTPQAPSVPPAPPTPATSQETPAMFGQYGFSPEQRQRLTQQFMKMSPAEQQKAKAALPKPRGPQAGVSEEAGLPATATTAPAGGSSVGKQVAPPSEILGPTPDIPKPKVPSMTADQAMAAHKGKGMSPKIQRFMAQKTLNRTPEEQQWQQKYRAHQSQQAARQQEARPTTWTDEYGRERRFRSKGKLQQFLKKYRSKGKKGKRKRASSITELGQLAASTS